MSNFNREIYPQEIKNIVSSSRSCRFDLAGCILESNFGRVSIDLSYSNNTVEFCTLHIKRISGNGKITIKCGENINSIIVSSKISQDIIINTNKYDIEISRPDDSSGEVCILGMTVGYYHKDEETTLSYNWKLLISKCGEYSCLRMVDNRLFASENAYISNACLITNIQTSPPNMTVLSGDKLKFIGCCEIIELTVDVSVKPPVLTQIYEHREEASPKIDLPPATITINYQKDIISNSPFQKSVSDSSSPINIIFDSSASGTFKSYLNDKLVKFINSNNKSFLLLKRTGVFSIPISTLTANKEYVVIINLKKINGNGKVTIGLGSEEGSAASYGTIIAQSNDSDKFVEISTKAGEYFKLFISMLDDSIGEVLISRIIIVENLQKNFLKYNEITIDNVINNNFKSEYLPSFALVNNTNGLIEKKKFVIVVPSYNNIRWCEKNILSAINQNYDNYRVIFTDDCSNDGTFEKVNDVVKSSFKKNKFTLTKNVNRMGALVNLYNMIHSCDDDEIILTLDGDDWLAHENVLNILNEAYSKDVWMTYGQYQNYPDGGVGVAQQIPNSVISSNSFRSYTWCSTHLRTFYSWLFKSIKKEDLCYNGEFYSMTWDMAMMFPMLEMAGNHSKFIGEFLYTYNMENPINDHKVNVRLQQDLDRYVRRMQKYQKIEIAPIDKKTIGLMIIATGKYNEYIQGIISSADTYFFNNVADVTYYIFSEKEQNIKSNRNIIRLPIEHKQWPFTSMDRFKHFDKYSQILSKEKYLYYVDVDCLFVDNVSEEIIGDLVGVCHCGYFNRRGPVETNTGSVFYTNPNRYKTYFGGGFSGGKANRYLELAKWCAEMIDKDVNNGIIPIFHDETAINRYFLENEPNIILSPSYHYPEANINHYKSIWRCDFPKKILLLEKNHSNMRK